VETGVLQVRTEFRLKENTMMPLNADVDPLDGLKFEIMRGPSNDRAVQKYCALFIDMLLICLSHV
jgi:hypothetical protein